jgi:hypothetical protein
MSREPIITRELFVDPSKVGKSRRRDSSETRRARKKADFVTEDAGFVRYSTRIGPVVPTAPLEESPEQQVPFTPPQQVHTEVDPDLPASTYSNTKVARTSDINECIGCSIILALIVSILIYASIPYDATLKAAKWELRATVQVFKAVQDSGWTLPFGAELISAEEKFYGWRTITDGITTFCQEEQRYTQVLSHYTDDCRQMFSHYESDKEVYSHTERVCVDGDCTMDEVYKKVPGKAVYTENCEKIPHYDSVPHWETVCKNIAQTHEEKEFRTFYVYSFMRWVYARSVHVNSDQVADPNDLLGENELLAGHDWTYELFFTDPWKVVKVSKNTFDEYKTKIGQVVTVPWK